MAFGDKGIFTVHEFTLAVKNIITGGQLNDVWIRGEISNCTNHNSGHRYFTLKDKNSQLQCVMFKWYGQSLKHELEYGMKVLVLGDIDVYEKRGQYQLKVRAIRPDGTGELYRIFEKLKNKLAMEGLFSSGHKKSLPGFPKKIGIATSETGAVLHDILTVMERRYPINLMFVPTIVQGEQAAESIVRSIELLNRTDVDIIILGRGGGSIEDLWAFNEEIVARSIFSSEIPIISAVGHETDYTIADFVADVRAPTPSAAAEIAVPDKKELKNQINRLNERLTDRMRRNLTERKTRLSELEKSVEPELFREKLSKYMQFIDEITRRQKVTISRILESKKALLKVQSGKLDAVSPLGVLSRGYSIVLKIPEKKPVSSINEVEEKDSVQIIVKNGKIICKVKDKEACTWK